MASSKYKETSHDYKLAYQGCFVRLLKPVGEEAPIGIVHRFHNEQDSEGRPPTRVTVRTFKLVEKEDTFVNIDDNRTMPLADVEFKSPRVGYVNTALGAMEIRAMKPGGSSKYCRLVHSENVQVITPCPDVISYLDAEPYKNIRDADILRFWSQEETTPVADAVTQLFNGERIARAISDKFCLSLSTKYDGVILLYNNVVAGVIPSPTEPLVLEKWAYRFKETLEGFGITIKE